MKTLSRLRMWPRGARRPKGRASAIACDEAEASCARKPSITVCHVEVAVRAAPSLVVVKKYMV